MTDDEAETLEEIACPKCGTRPMPKVDVEDYVEGLFRRAEAAGGKVRLISSESEEGEMLAKAFGGVAALLRYPMATRAPRAVVPRAPAANASVAAEPSK